MWLSYSRVVSDHWLVLLCKSTGPVHVHFSGEDAPSLAVRQILLEWSNQEGLYGQDIKHACEKREPNAVFW
jgi:hypothetical protein